MGLLTLKQLNQAMLVARQFGDKSAAVAAPPHFFYVMIPNDEKCVCFQSFSVIFNHFPMFPCLSLTFRYIPSCVCFSTLLFTALSFTFNSFRIFHMFPNIAYS